MNRQSLLRPLGLAAALIAGGALLARSAAAANCEGHDIQGVAYPGHTTNDLFGPAVVNTALSSPALANSFSLADIFGAVSAGLEPGNCVFADGGEGSVHSVFFSLPAPVMLNTVTVWLSDERPASRFVLKLADTNFAVLRRLADVNLQVPYDPAYRAPGGPAVALIQVKVQIAPVQAQYLVAEFTQAKPGLGLRVVELDGANAVPVQAGLKLWFDGARVNGLDQPPADGAPVVLWRDLSGAGLDAAPPFGSAPVYRTNAINGQPGVDFSVSGSDALATAVSSQLGLTNATIIMVGNGGGMPTHVSLSAPGLAQEFILGDTAIYHHSSAYHWVRRTHQEAPAGYYIHAGFFGARSNQLDNCINGVFSTNRLFNSWEIGQGAAVEDYAPVARQAVLGWRNSDANGAMPIAIENFGGVLCEVLVYDRLLSEAELDCVDVFLGKKYGISETPIAPGLEARGGGLIHWSMRPGRVYQVQSTTNVAGSDWMNEGGLQRWPGLGIWMNQATPPPPAIFYRLKVSAE